jgi:hypothetical protein
MAARSSAPRESNASGPNAAQIAGSAAPPVVDNDNDRTTYNDDDPYDDVDVDAEVLAYEEPHFTRRSTVPLLDARGAGAILFSSLVYQGWRFPPFLLVDTDEKHLFELEIKVRRNGTACCAEHYHAHHLSSVR